MNSFKKILAVVFSLLLILMMVPVLPGQVYADDAPTVQDQLSKPVNTATADPAPQPDREARMLKRALVLMDTDPPSGYSEAKGPYALDGITLSEKTPAAETYMFASVYDENGDYVDPNEVNCTWYYQDGSGWDTIPEVPSDDGSHIITVPGYALGKKLKVVAVPKSSSSYTGSAEVISPKIISSTLDEIEVYPLGYGFYVGTEIDPYAYYIEDGKYHLINNTYIHYDYYVGEGSSWTEFSEGVYNWYSYIPFIAEGKYLKVVAHVMADQDAVLGGPCAWVSHTATQVFPLDDNFHDETLPSGWAVIDANGDGHNWQSKSGNPNFISLSGDYDGECIASPSWDSDVGDLTPDNWLISPSFYVPQHSKLAYWVTGQDSKDYKEHYGVYITTSDSFDLWTYEQIGSETVSTYRDYQKRTIDLSAYAGKKVHIAFRHYDCTGQYWLCLDGVSIESHLVRIAGKTRYDTSLDIAGRFMNLKGLIGLDEVIVCTGDAFPDALSGSTYSVAYNAPVLLISSKSAVSQEKAFSFIDKYLKYDGNIVLIGGTSAVPQKFEDRLLAHIDTTDQHLDRISGKDRYKTNLEVLKELPYIGDTILVCDGTNYADAATASATGRPVLLVGKDGLTAEQKSFLGSISKRHYIVIGGEGAVSAAIFNELKSYDFFGAPERVYGKNRALTAVEVAKAFFPGGYSLDTVVFAYGGNYPDCISGGLLANTLGAPILYGDSAVNSSYFKADDPYFQSNDYISMAYILGGPSLVSDEFAIALLAKG